MSLNVFLGLDFSYYLLKICLSGLTLILTAMETIINWLFKNARVNRVEYVCIYTYLRQRWNILLLSSVVMTTGFLSNFYFHLFLLHWSKNGECGDAGTLALPIFLHIKMARRARVMTSHNWFSNQASDVDLWGRQSSNGVYGSGIQCQCNDR